MERIQIQMHCEMVSALSRIAQGRDISLGQLVRELGAKEITRVQKARPPNRADEQLVAPLRARLATPLAEASDWHDLQMRLRALGYELKEAGGGLALYTHPTGIRQCKASELGFSYSKLMRRFSEPFPGHAHTWLAKRMLNKGDDDFSLIEPF